MTELIAHWKKRPLGFVVTTLISVLLALAGVSAFLTISRTGGLLPVVLGSFAAALGLSSNLTFSMARALEKREEWAFHHLNGLAALLFSCTLMMLRAAFVSIAAIPLSVAWQSTHFAVPMFWGIGVTHWQQANLIAGFVALVYAALQFGSACIGAALVFPFLAQITLNYGNSDKWITPELERRAGRLTSFGELIGAVPNNLEPTESPASGEAEQTLP